MAIWACAKNRMSNNYIRIQAARGKIKYFQHHCQSGSRWLRSSWSEDLSHLDNSYEMLLWKKILCIRQKDFQCMRKSQTSSLQDQRLKNRVHESCSSSLYIGDVQRQPVIGGVNWQIQYKSRACSLSSSPSKARSLNREWILSCCLNPWIASYHSANIPMLHPTPMCQEEKTTYTAFTATIK